MYSATESLKSPEEVPPTHLASRPGQGYGLHIVESLSLLVEVVIPAHNISRPEPQILCHALSLLIEQDQQDTVRGVTEDHHDALAEEEDPALGLAVQRAGGRFLAACRLHGDLQLTLRSQLLRRALKIDLPDV